MADIYVLIYIILAILIFNLISLYLVLKKQKYILSNHKKQFSHSRKCTNQYVKRIELKLFNLGFPYKLTTKRYLFIKYVLSVFAFVFAYLNYYSFKTPFIIFLIIFFTPEYLIHNYITKEKYILINELKNVVNSLVLSLSAKTTLEQALKQSLTGITYVRFKENYEGLIKEYEMNGYNLQSPARMLESKFKTYELTLFLGTLVQGEREGTLLESLEKYNNALELNYFKYLKRKMASNLLYVTFGIVLSLINIVAVVMYPILVQVLNNLQLIFT